MPRVPKEVRLGVSWAPAGIGPKPSLLSAANVPLQHFGLRFTCSAFARVWPFAPDSVQFRCERLRRSLPMERLLLFSHLRKENLEAFISGVAFLLQSDYRR